MKRIIAALVLGVFGFSFAAFAEGEKAPDAKADKKAKKSAKKADKKADEKKADAPAGDEKKAE